MTPKKATIMCKSCQLIFLNWNFILAKYEYAIETAKKTPTDLVRLATLAAIDANKNFLLLRETKTIAIKSKKTDSE